MIQTYHQGRFKFFVAVIVIAIIALAGLGRYALMAEDARVLRLEIISHHFMTGAANARIQYLVNGLTNKTNEQEPFDVAGQLLFFSEQGWPVSTLGPVGKNHQPGDKDCYHLWQLFLQNPPSITVGQIVTAGDEFRVFAHANSCRFGYGDGTTYFDYYPLDGRLIFVSEHNKSFSINDL